MKILIADDSDIIRSRMKDLVSECTGITDFLESRTGEETITVLKENAPEALILDLSMPLGGGFYVLEYIQKNELNILTIVLTNYSSKEYKLRCERLGVQYFFDKSDEFLKVCEILRHEIPFK